MDEKKPSTPRQVTKSYSQAGPYVSLGIQFALTTLVGLFGGQWLDAKLETTPAFLIVGTLLGAVAGFYKLYRTLVDLNEKDHALKDDPKKGAN